jgi:hypothetical protein
LAGGGSGRVDRLLELLLRDPDAPEVDGKAREAEEHNYGKDDERERLATFVSDAPRTQHGRITRSRPTRSASG